jgi:hypothetical protein
MKTLHSILFVLLAVNILCAVGLWFAYGMMSDAKTKEVKLREQLFAESQKNDQLIGLESALRATKKDREELAQFLYSTSDEDQIKFISRIEQMGTSSSGAIVETTQLELTKTKPPVLRGEFGLKGTWGQLFHVLRLVEESPARTTVNRFEVRGMKDAWFGVMKIELVSLSNVK